MYHFSLRILRDSFKSLWLYFLPLLYSNEVIFITFNAELKNYKIKDNNKNNDDNNPSFFILSSPTITYVPAISD